MNNQDTAIWNIIEARDASVQSLRHIISDLEKSLTEKEKVIAEVVATQQRLEQLSALLAEKEALIEQQAQGLQAYRAAFFLFRPVLRPLNKVVLKGFGVVRPRLGNLNQYGPRLMALPSSYTRAKDLSHTPKISIVTPSFRQAAFIERTIKSVLEQSYSNLEYYVQDGGSEDGTCEILNDYAEQLSGWESRPDEGQSQAINLGFAHTTGDIMAWLNSDDILLPGALACVADYFVKHPGVDVVYGHRLLIDENDQQIGRWMMPSHNDEILSWADYIPQETLFWRRSIWEKAGGSIDESFRFAMDWDLLVRFREAGARFTRIPRFLGGFRVHSQQKTSAAIDEIGNQEMDRIRQRVLGRIPSKNEVRRAVFPYMFKHVITDLRWRVTTKLMGSK